MEEKLKQLLSEQNSRPLTARWRCASENQLAAYVDGNVDTPTRQKVEAHLANCAACLNKASFLIRSSDWDVATNFPLALTAKAKQIINQPTRRFAFDWRWAPAALATCLTVVVLIALFINLRQPRTPTEQSLVQPPPKGSPN